MQFLSGKPRDQLYLIPTSLEEVISSDNVTHRGSTTCLRRSSYFALTDEKKARLAIAH